ncbi:MAG: glycosyltransferase [Thermogemmatispora sp.]|uniref:glycosyltransferase n=1 Tax=Thermogemmatispora sp. TaxID=1968838 RepID=UPI0026111D71|nr:glycosyltransferase [Thermogemmatispora sp.]MBX5456109.1 glycosyltransferase [Thermogemmatispora sp.]
MSRKLLKQVVLASEQSPRTGRLVLRCYACVTAAFYLFLHWIAHPYQRSIALRHQQSEAGADELPAVSIIVPARNEEANIWRCVRSLLLQDYPGDYEVIVVDDGSTDHTRAILERLALEPAAAGRLHLVSLSEELPPGWAGKPHALHAGACQARGSWLVFTDADSYWAPQTLRLTLSEALARNLDLLSLVPEQVLVDGWNRLTLPLALMGMSLQFPPPFVNLPCCPLATANGQYILLRRSVYEALGGYARPELRGSPLDDRDLAAVVKRLGYRLALCDGRGLVRVQMYRGLPALWRGWRKTIFVGSGGLPFMMAALMGLPLVVIVPFLLPLLLWLGQSWWRQQGVGAGEAALVTGLTLLPLLAYRRSLDKSLGLPWYQALTHPLAGLLFMGMLAQACWRKLTGRGVEWRGRVYGARSRIPLGRRALGQLFRRLGQPYH